MKIIPAATDTAETVMDRISRVHWARTVTKTKTKRPTKTMCCRCGCREEVRYSDSSGYCGACCRCS